MAFNKMKKLHKKLDELVAAINSSITSGDLIEAEMQCRELNKFLLSLPEQSQSFEMRCLVIEGYYDLGAAYRCLGRKNEAEDSFIMTVSILMGMKTEDPSSYFVGTVLASCKNHIGILYDNVGDLETAQAYFGEAAQLRKKLVSEYPDDIENKVFLADVLCADANVARKMHDTQKAVSLYEESISILDTVILSCGCGDSDAMVQPHSRPANHSRLLTLAQDALQKAKQEIEEL